MGNVSPDRSEAERLTASIEALVVLGLIMGLVLSDFLYDAALFAGAAAAGEMTDLMASEMRFAVVGAASRPYLMGSSSVT